MARRRNIRFPALLDAVAPALLVAQAIGRLGNWFNQELFGRPTTLPWALEIDAAVPAGRLRAVRHLPPDLPLRDALVPGRSRPLLVVLDRRFRLGHGKVFALYVMLYTAGRFWIEALRIDTVNEIGGFRLNNYTSLIVFLAALIWFVWLVRNRPGREEVVEGDPSRARRAANFPSQPADADDRPLRLTKPVRPDRRVPTVRTARTEPANGGLRRRLRPDRATAVRRSRARRCSSLRLSCVSLFPCHALQARERASLPDPEVTASTTGVCSMTAARAFAQAPGRRACTTPRSSTTPAESPSSPP